jgi:glycosyltransferase involved in cell wall biosynthesis
MELLADAEDLEEHKLTFQLLATPKFEICARAAVSLAQRLSKVLGVLKASVGFGVHSPSGIAIHLAYLVEAAFLFDWCRRREITHIHVHFGTNAAMVALLLSKLGGPSYSLTFHGPDEFDAPVGLALREKIAGAKFVTAISHFTAGQLMRWAAPEDWHKISVVHMALQPSYFNAARPVDPTSRNLVVVGRLSAQKGHIVILEAFARVLSQYLNATLTLVGDGEYRSLVEERIAALGIGHRVTITGWADEQGVKQHITNARALVLGSFAEGLPVVLMEALALGRPVVTTSIAGIPELVSEGVGGYIVPSGSVEHLAEGMRRALAAPVEELEALAAAGRERVMRDHNLETEVAKLEALFLKHAS